MITAWISFTLISSFYFTPTALIYWDPDPNVFIIPYFEHPLRWYGLLFALGFVGAFLLLLPILKHKLSLTKALLPRDISNWRQFLTDLQLAINDSLSPLHTWVMQLSKPTLKLISHVKYPPATQEQSYILSSLTDLQRNASITIERTNLEKLLPKSINSLHSIAYSYIDRLLWFIVIGTMVGARLGHVIFYEWPRYSANPIEILKIWEGGLASHGGTLGVILAVYIYARLRKAEFPEISFLGLCDLLTIPAAFICVCIRLGNFVNQEILGTPSSLPWAITFGHPSDGSAALSRHPVQLYEALAYLATLGILWRLWKAKGDSLPSGFMTGLLFVLIFGSRFFLEFFKAPQSMMIDESFIQTGQLLSLPFVIAGFILMMLNSKKENNHLISTVRSDKIKLP